MNARAIPERGATLIIASHGNDLPDILMSFLATDRDVLFVANIAAADSPLVRMTYRGLGVIPVSRVRDARALKARGEDASALNADAFVRVVDALQRNEAVVIFPEGNVHEYPHLGKLRTGAAKMALQAIESSVESLTLVPIGYQYEHASTPRSGLLGVVGTPVEVARWTPENPRKAITEFTLFMRDRLCEVTRNARATNDARVLSSFAAAAGAALSTKNITPMAAAHEVQLWLSNTSASDGVFVADSIAPHLMPHANAIREFQHHSQTLSNYCAEFGANSWSARDIADVLLASGCDDVSGELPSAFGVYSSAPLAAVAWTYHALPFWLSRKIALKYAPNPTDIAARTLLPGLYIMEAWYLLAPLALWFAGLPGWLVGVLFIAQPRLGDFALGWSDRARAVRLAGRVRGAGGDRRQSLRVARDELRASWERVRGLG